MPLETALGSGGHLRFSVQDQSEVISVPHALSTGAMAGLVLAQVGWNGASRPPLERGDLAVVLGDGLVGQYAAQSLRARGARVLLIGRRPMRLDLARRYSADAIHDARKGGLNEAIEDFRRLNPRLDRNRGLEPWDWMRPEELALRDPRAPRDANGADVIVDTTGSREMVCVAASLLRHNGHLVLLGWYPEPENELLEDWFHQREIAVYGTGGWRRHRLLAALNAILTRHLRTAELVTHQVPVEEAPRVYQGLLIEKREDSLGVIFDWGP